VPGAHQIGGDGCAHVTQPDEADFHVLLLDLLNSIS
jgi:hypothetical protein